MGEQIKRPTPAEVDALIERYEEANALACSGGAIIRLPGEPVAQLKARLDKHLKAAAAEQKAWDEEASQKKSALVATVQRFGRRHTEKTKLLEGTHHKASTTTAVMTSTDPEGVERLHEYVEQQDLTELEGRLFQKHVTYSLVETPDEVLREVTLGKRIREKLTSLVKSCIRITTKAPSLKVNIAKVEPAKARAA